MKHLLVLFIFTLSLQSYGQRNYDDWMVNVGINAINSLGTQSPINSPEDWAFRHPIAVSVEKGWSELFSIELAASFNGFEENVRFDPRPATEDFTYFGLDTHIKYYFGEHIFPREDWIDFYGSAGIGMFTIDEANISINAGGGVLVWLNRYRTFGLRAQIIGKFAFDNANSGFDNNHYQYNLQAVFKL